MIDWVHDSLRDWGRAQYWLLFGKQGYPTRTMLGKLIEEGVVGASCNQFTIEYPEVLMGRNLQVANAVKTLAEMPRTVVSAHYVFRMPAKQKYTKLGMSHTKYYNTLSQAHLSIANALQAAEIQELRKDVQKSPKVSRTNFIFGSRLKPTMA